MALQTENLAVSGMPSLLFVSCTPLILACMVGFGNTVMTYLKVSPVHSSGSMI